MRQFAGSLPDVAACAWAGLQLTAEAYAGRLRRGRSPFSPTFPARPRPLARASLAGRRLLPEPFLRPTEQCDCHAPEVLALADEMRARARDDWEYATAVFDFVRQEIDQVFDRPPRRGVVETLERGFGTCHDKLNLLVALARAGGIPARYCTIGLAPGGEGVLALTGPTHAALFGALAQPSRRFLAEDNDPRAKRLVALLLREFAKAGQSLQARFEAGTLPAEQNEWSHYVAELRVGQAWIPVDPTYGDEDCVAYDLPLPRFGYEPFLLTRHMGMAIQGRSEAIPLPSRYPRARRWVFLAGIALARGLFDHVNVFAARERVRGRRILAEVGAPAIVQRRRHLYRRVAAVAAEPGLAVPAVPSA